LAEAEKQRERFLGLYPTLARGLEDSIAFGLARRYATTVSGLRRHANVKGRGSSWTRNFLRNTPIQGSAAVVFKRAVIALDQAFRGTDTRVVLPVHDAVLIECSIEDLDQICGRARTAMEDALRSIYPQLIPRVDVNRADPSCWNKDGHSDSLDRFLEDPAYKLGDPSPPPDPNASWPELAVLDEIERPIDLPYAAGLGEPDRLLVNELFTERAGILEFEAGLSRAEAETRATAMIPRMFQTITGRTLKESVPS
jgi:hypothetical protein